MCADSFLKSESFEFSIEESRIHREVDLDPTRYTYEEVVSLHKAHYRSLIGQGLWNEANGTNSMETKLVGLKGEISNLRNQGRIEVPITRTLRLKETVMCVINLVI